MNIHFISTIIVLLFFLFLIASLTIYVYYRYFRRKYTKERFAFFGLRTVAAFFIFALPLIFIRNPLIEFVFLLIDSSSQFPDFQKSEYLLGGGLILFCGIILALLNAYLFKNWNTLDQYSQFRNQNPKQTIKQPEIVEDAFHIPEPDSRPWNKKVQSLLPLLDHQYDISDESWIINHNSFISNFGPYNNKVIIHCPDQIPSLEETSALIQYFSLENISFSRIIVALQGHGKKKAFDIEGKSVEFKYESEILDDLINTSSYKRYLNHFFNIKKLENSALSLKGIYIPLSGAVLSVNNELYSKGEEISSVENYILKWVKDQTVNSSEQLVVLGDYGQGKTVLMHKIALEMLNNPREYRRIPILIELRGTSPRNLNQARILEIWASRFNMKSQALVELNNAGRLFLIFDGFDEMDLVGDTTILRKHFNKIWSLAAPKTKILVTGRSNLFANNEERKMALGIGKAKTSALYSKTISLNKLTKEQINKFLRNTSENTKMGILNAIENSSDINDLFTRPSTLFQLSTIWESDLIEDKTRLNTAKVIDVFIAKSYDRQQSKGDTTPLTTYERDYFMMGIAIGMMLKYGYTNQIKHEDLAELINDLWRTYPPELPPYGDSMQNTNINEPLPRRMKENEDAFATILKDVRSAGIIVQDLSGRDIFKFSHKSYFECLVSKFYANYILRLEHKSYLNLKINSIVKATKTTLTKLPPSASVSSFLAEFLIDQVEVKNDIGQRLSIETNKKKYSNELFNKLIIKSFPISGRYFPTFTGWISLQTFQKFFIYIFLFSVIIWVVYFSIMNSYSGIELISINSILCLTWGYLLIINRKNLRSETDLQISSYTHYSKNFLLCCLNLELPQKKFSKKLKNLLFADWATPEALIIIDSTIARTIILPGLTAGFFSLYYSNISPDVRFETRDFIAITGVTIILLSSLVTMIDRRISLIVKIYLYVVFFGLLVVLSKNYVLSIFQRMKLLNFTLNSTIMIFLGLIIAIISFTSLGLFLGKQAKSKRNIRDYRGFEDFNYKSSNTDWSSSYSQHKTENIEKLYDSSEND